MSRKSLKPGALTAPLPPVLVTVGEGENSNIITIGWTGILSTHPPRTYVSVRPERHSHGLLRRHGEFVINLTTADMARKVDYCGVYTGAKVDKFKECGFTRVDSSEVSVPSIGECPLSIECRVVEVIPMGTHDVFIADIVGVSCDESIIDESGRLCFEKAGLLAYAHGEYFALGDKVGSFGFSAQRSTRKRSGSKSDGRDKSSPRAQNGKQSKNGSQVGATKHADKAVGDSSAGRARSETGKGGAVRTEQRSDGHRPFYLDAPRGGRGKRGRKK